MSQRMIFFPNKRKTSLGRLSIVAAIMAITAGIFLAGVRVGVQNAAVIHDTAPLLTAELVSFER